MDDLLREFLTETNENLDVADVELVKFEQDPNNAQILNNIFRLVHTIKGTCGFIGLPRLASLAHAAETLMDKFRQGTPVTTDAVGLVLVTIDRIKQLLAELEAREGAEPEGSDEDLISRLEAMAAGSALAPLPTPAAPPPAPVAPKATGGTLSNQTLERELKPGEVPLDELERVFRETAVEAPKAPPAPEVHAQGGRGEEAAAAGGVSAQTIRVNVGTLEHLMTMVSELVLTRNQLMEIARRQEESDYKVSLQRLSTVTAELQEAVMRTRMQPIGNAWQKLPRIVRDLAQELGKQIELEMSGADTELDRQVLDLIKDPLTHMVRNSADHGLEGPADRRAAGKPEKGTIHLDAHHEGGHIVIEISDDGRGLNTDRIRAKALENRLATEAELAKMTDAQIHRFIFAAGFSTATKITNVSGRGVGMDVVRTNIELIGGTVDVRSRAGQGSVFTIKIPLTLAIVPALIVEAAGERFAIPQLVVVELVRIQPGSEHTIERVKDAPVLRLRDKLLPIVPLAGLLRTLPNGGQDVETGFVAVMQVGNQTFGIVVDGVLHTEEIVVKPMSSMLRHITMFSGSTILGDGRVIMIVDPNGVAQAVATSAETAAAETHVDDENRRDEGDEIISLLLFRAGSVEPKAVPLSLVTRLEEFDVSKIEHTGGRPVAQYRGSLLPLVYVDDKVERRTTGTQPVLVFSDNGRSMGLVVDEIVDIVQDRLNIELTSEGPGLLGAAVISGKATALVDIGHYLSIAFADWFERKSSSYSTTAGRLLLVDDSAFFRGLIGPVLRGMGYEVVTCASAPEALDRLSRDTRFNVIVSDIDMPEMDGFSFASAVRSRPHMSSIPIIALSGVCTPEAIARGRDVGFTDYIGKFDRSGLISALSEFTGHIQGEAA